MSDLTRSRDVLMVLAGISVLLIKHWISDWFGVFVYSYLGNFSVSFAVYFLASLAVRQRAGRAIIVVLALLAVELFELTDGFGIMTNVYDRFDLLANALGIALALGVDVASVRLFPLRTGDR